MKKTISAILFIILFYSGFSQSYKEQLKNINEFLKTFDNGYYGYLEIKDGYLYDRFKDGNNYCRAKIIGLNKAYEKESSRKVELPCKGTDNCLYSTFTNQNYNSFSFSQATDFNTAELISLLDNLIAACKGNDTKNKDGNKSIDYASEKRRQESLKSKTDNNNTTSLKSNSTENYQTALKKLNDYLKIFDNGYYGYWEVKDGYIYDRFKAGKYNKFKMEDMEGAVIQPEYSRVIFKCKGDNKCIETDWKPNGREDYTQFTTNGSYNYKELADLLNNFRDAYLGKKSTNSTSNPTQKYTESSEFLDGLKSNIDIADSGNNRPPNGRERVKNPSGNSNVTSTVSYTDALVELNKFLKDYDKELNKSIEVNNGYIIEHFRGSYTSKAKIKDIAGVETDAKYNVVHLYCKNNAKCVYSDYMKSNYDYFNYNCSSASQMNTLYKLMTEFWNQLNGISSSTSTSNSSNSSQKYTESSEFLDGLKSNIDITNSGSSSSSYQTSLSKLNDFLKTFAKGFYIKLEVIDGYIFTRFENGYFNQFKMQDMQDAVIDEANHKVLFKCKGDIYCQTTTWKKNSNYYSHFIDDNATYEQLVKLRDLLNTFKKDYLADKNNTITTTNNDDIDFDKYKSNINISDNSNTASSNTKPTPKINYEIVAKQPSVFKKGDRVVIEIGSFDDHFQLNKKSEYDGETGTVINLEYDDLNYSYYGKIKMDSDKKIVEFTDITPQLIKIK